MSTTPPPDLTGTITQAVADPLIMESAQQKVQSRSVGELIEADRYVKSQAALTGSGTGPALSGWRGLRPARVIPPGAV